MRKGNGDALFGSKEASADGLGVKMVLVVPTAANDRATE
jgi:hypothetical protein